ncbi:MAG: hypothetical protein J0G95_01280 [Rhizobiales bacterium]|nr:hypothetical protein [Hyphomicrobiales bacterium]
MAVLIGGVPARSRMWRGESPSARHENAAPRNLAGAVRKSLSRYLNWCSLFLGEQFLQWFIAAHIRS